MEIDLITLITTLLITINTLVLVPLFKFVFYVLKEINYIKGHLNIDL